MQTVNVTLTEEMKQKLKGALGFTVQAEFKYVPRIFREVMPKDMWPLFTLTSRDGIDISEAEDAVGEVVYNGEGKQSSIKINSGTQRIKILETGLLSVKRYPAEDGALISFDRKTATLAVGGDVNKSATVRDLIRYLPPGVQTELANAITERRTLTEEELTGLEL